MHLIKRVLPLLVVVVCSCTLPQYIWPQKDIGFHEINPPDLDKRVLIASRDSEFKRAVIDRILIEFQDQPVYLKVIGIDAGRCGYTGKRNHRTDKKGPVGCLNAFIGHSGRD